LVFLARALAVLPALLLAGCTGLIFQPLTDHLLTPDRIGLAWRDVAFTTADGVRLHGWFLPASAPRQGSVLFLHGNAENISTHIASVAWLPDAGFDVLLFDYRGYGRSAGRPSLDGLQRDFDAALGTLLAMPEVDPQRVVVFGQSLGGALAITALASSPRKR
jgi:alpha-beta hydrolase superfamily lysophospholipase